MALSGLVFRLIKGSPLTAAEGDGNLTIIRDAFNALQALFGVVLKPNGTLKDGAVGSTAVIADGVVTNAKLATDAKMPAGVILPYGGGTVPTGWLEANGQAVSRTTYADLFTALGTTWGAGNGTTTFNVPDFRGRAPVGDGTGAGLTARVLGTNFGEENHTQTEDELVPHSHTILARTSTGAGGAGGSAWVGDDPTGSTDATGGGDPFNVCQPSVVCKFIVKT
jgi:hypothetical protein